MPVIMNDIDKHVSFVQYKDTMKRVVRMYYPNLTDTDLDYAVDYSINKRYTESQAKIVNNYNNRSTDMTLLELADYINSRQPIVTAAGVMFKKHGEVPNPLAKVIQDFLDSRAKYKKMMFKYPKGSEDYEKYNLLQQLAKIDVNALYGTLGQSTSLIYNIHVASSITAQGRALISSTILLFESFLANSVKFGSLNEVVQFIDNIRNERRQYKDYHVLDNDVSIEDCFAKVILSTGFRWVPSEEEMEVIWRMLHNCSQEDINRIYYKNNLYEFMSNSSMVNAIKYIIRKLELPYMNPLECPKEIQAEMDELTSIIMEYVYYGYMYIDRIDKVENMVRSVCMVSDTDSAIISLDGWYRFCLDNVKDEKYNILKYKMDALYFDEVDEFGDNITNRYKKVLHFEEPDYDFDFFNDEVIELEHINNPTYILPQDNLRYTIINIMAYVLDKVANDYMEKFSKNNHSFRGEGKCKLILKNEFTFRRMLMTGVKKSYATIQEVQEGNFIKQDMETSLDIKGIASMAKSSMADSTRDALKRILYEDILNSEEIDQMKVVKHLAILEKKIMQSLYNGSKEYYKPAICKAMNAYDDPMRQQQVKASIVWNALRDDNMVALDMSERNSIDIAKVTINATTVEKIKDKYPELYSKCQSLLNDKYFKGSVECIGIPNSENVPEWLSEFINYNEIVNDNISGFPLEAIGVMRLENNNINYSNILKL